jgi:hypothetical protein
MQSRDDFPFAVIQPVQFEAEISFGAASGFV